MNVSIKSTTHSHSLSAEELKDRTASGSLEISNFPNNTSHKKILISTRKGLFRNNSASLSTKVIAAFMPLRSNLKHSLTFDIKQYENIFYGTNFNSRDKRCSMNQSMISTRPLYRKYITKESLDSLIQFWNNKLVEFRAKKRALQQKINAKIAARKSRSNTDQKAEVISKPEDVDALPKDGISLHSPYSQLHETKEKHENSKNIVEESEVKNNIIPNKERQYREINYDIKPMDKTIKNSHYGKINEWKEHSWKFTIVIPFIVVMV